MTCYNRCIRDENRVEKLQQRPCGLQNLTYLLPGPLRKVCWPHTLNDRARPAAWTQAGKRGQGGYSVTRRTFAGPHSIRKVCSLRLAKPPPALQGKASPWALQRGIWENSSCPPVRRQQEVTSGTQHCSVPVPKMHDERGHQGTTAVGRGQGPESSLGSEERRSSSQEEGETVAAHCPVGGARGPALEVSAPGGLR